MASVAAVCNSFRETISCEYKYKSIWASAGVAGCPAFRSEEQTFHKEQYTHRRGAHWAPEGYDILTASFIRNTFRVLSLRAANGRPYVNQVKNNHAEQSDKRGFRINGISV